MIPLHKSIIDRIGIGLSVLCLIHCIALPLVYLILPTFNFHDDSEITHLLLGLLVIGLAVPAFKRGYEIHRKKLPVLLGSFGCLILGIAFLAPEAAIFSAGTVQVNSHAFITMLGSVLLVAGHVINMRSCPCGKAECHSTEAPRSKLVNITRGLVDPVH